MRRTLLITNDFPPRIGGIQSYVHELAGRLPADDLTVLTSRYPGDAAFDAAQPFTVVRHPASVLLPTPAVAAHAVELVRREGMTAVWFGAAAPLALLTPRLRDAGIQRTVASTHGHEVGWAMTPGARRLLRRIGTATDVITYVSRYARRRMSAALGAQSALEHLPPGVDTGTFRPDPEARARLRARYGFGEAPVVACVSRLVPRKGQDVLIKAWPSVLAAHPTARLLIAGDGPYRDRLVSLARSGGVTNSVTFTGGIDHAELAGHYAAADVFAMPCRTRGGGLDVEGLGIVFLEASACGLPVIAGRSGGAPETIVDGRTGTLVDGRSVTAVAAALRRLLDDGELRARWGAAGRRWVQEEWTWQRSAERLTGLLTG